LKNDTHYTFFFFPFHGKKWSDSGDFQATTILWPFFSWATIKKQMIDLTICHGPLSKYETATDQRFTAESSSLSMENTTMKIVKLFL
jgi:hypothetical protein